MGILTKEQENVSPDSFRKNHLLSFKPNNVSAYFDVLVLKVETLPKVFKGIREQSLFKAGGSLQISQKALTTFLSFFGNEMFTLELLSHF